MALSNSFTVSIVDYSTPGNLEWIPASGFTKVVATTNTFKSQDPCPSDSCDYNNNFNGTGHKGLTDAYSGGVDAPDLGPSGSLLLHGGGHNDYGGNETYRLDLATLTWSRMDNPSTGVDSFNLEPQYGFWNEYLELSDGQPGSAHTYGNLVVVSPEFGGGPNGTLVRSISQAVGAGGSPPNTGWSHGFDLSNPSQRWYRYSNQALYASPLPGGAACFDDNRGRIWQISSNTPSSYHYLDVVTKNWTKGSVSKSFTGPGIAPDCLCCTFDTQRDLFIVQVAKYNASTDNGIRLYWLDPTNPAAGYNRVSLALESGVAPPRGYWFGIDYCPDNGKYYMLVDWRPDGPWEVTPSANLTDPWSCVQLPWQGDALDISKATAHVNNISTGGVSFYQRWSYCPKVKCFVMFPYANATEVIVFRPPGV